MNSSRRPLSPFMIGPYYRPQLTSMLSIMHRLTGLFLALVTAPVLTWWLVALAISPQAFASISDCLSGTLGCIFGVLSLYCLTYHLFNGIRHLVWDTGRWLGLDAAYRSGWAVVALSLLTTALISLRLGGVI